MDTINLDNIRRNAYRVLGLTGRATQQEIESAARMLRLLGSGEASPTPNDAAWMGPVARNSNDVESALTRLTDPELRARERVWWYCDQAPATDAAGAGSGRSGICQRHDEALTGFCRLLIKGTDRPSLGLWIDLLGDCREVARSEDYRQWMLEVERRGDFEKGASLEELAALQGQFGEQAATALVGLADDCLADNDYAGAGRVYDILRDVSDGGKGAVGAAMGRILDRMEDALIGACHEYIAQVDDAWKTRQAPTLKMACARALRGCDQNLAGLTGELERRLGDDPDRALRIRGQFVAVYVHIADAYEAAHDKYFARKTLLEALSAAAGTAAEPRLRQRIDSLASAKPLPTPVGASPARGNGGGGRGLGRGAYVLFAIVGMALMRMCAQMSRESATNYGTSDRWSPPVMPAQDLQKIEDLLRESRARTQPAWPDLRIPGAPATGPGMNLTAPPLSLEPLGPVTSRPRGRGPYVPATGPAGVPPGRPSGPGIPGMPGTPGAAGNFPMPEGG